ncbi:MAG TPA: S9 family peptidase [Gemmatimonadaceae bacterium]
MRLSALAAAALAAAGMLLTPSPALRAQGAPAGRAATADSLTIEAIFQRGAYRGASMPGVVWLADGRSYLDLRADPAGGTDIVRIDLVTGDTTELADAATLVAPDGSRLTVEEVALSADESKALLYHNSVRVWRSNTRGRYTVLDVATKRTTPVSTREGLQMFAKLSPDGRQVAFVRDNDLWVADLASGAERRLTSDGSETIINGTTDWVYEEELGLRDAFRWSPDGTRIAFWRFDQSAVPEFPMVDELGLYPEVETLRYPKAGEANSRVQVGVLTLANGAVRWIDVGADTGIYIARMQWVGRDSLSIQRLPRAQNRVDLLMASATTGGTRTIMSDRDSAYVDVEGDAVRWIDGGRRFLWLSDRSGWRQVWLHDRSGTPVRQVTRDGVDVLSIEAVDERAGTVYVTAAAPTPTQRQVYAHALSGRGEPRRITTAPGAHRLSIGPTFRYAVDVHSDADTPPVATLHDFPSMRRVRVLESNAQLASSLASLGLRAPEFFTVPLPNGTRLDAVRILPADFDSTRRYPVLMYVYGGPAAPTVTDQWSGSRYLWHQLLAQKGVVVVSVDNRGAAWRGRDFRKITQFALGSVESQDQIDAARWLARQSWVNGEEIGIWGWSYGGYLSSLTAAKGGDLFDMAIAVAPVTDWRLYDTIYTERFMGLPSANAKGYDESAPQSHVAGLTAKYLIVHGTGDDNVHPQNTMQMAKKLQEAGKPFSMLLYPNLTHSISGGNAQYHLYRSMTEFVLDNLGPVARPVM